MFSSSSWSWFRIAFNSEPVIADVIGVSYAFFVTSNRPGSWRRIDWRSFVSLAFLLTEAEGYTNLGRALRHPTM